MKTTTQIVDEEHEFLRDRAYVEVENYERQTEFMQELFEMEQAKVVIGKVRKSRKNVQYARVTTGAKFPRFISIQSNSRRLQGATHLWNRSEPSVYTGMPF